MTAARVLWSLLAILFVIACVRCAWTSDDAWITFRTVDHLLGGHGLRYNVDERVQAYTHPLWMLALVGACGLTGEFWLTSMALGLVTSVAALVALGAPRPLGGAVATAVLIGSKAAVDYATSGLENPLENLLLVGFASLLLGRARLPWLVLTAALLGLVRLDALVLVAPALALAVHQDRGRSAGAVALALAPIVVWHGFALAYYGSLLPNTAAAKLGTGIPHAALAVQALWYLAWTARVDPITLVAIAAGLGAGLRLRDARATALAAGIALHGPWLLWIGGDFMGGRFLVAPAWLGLALVARLPWRPVPAGLVIAAAFGSLLSPRAPLRSGPDYARAGASHGVVDERGYYWHGTGLWAGSNLRDGPTHPFVADGLAARGTDLSTKAVIGLYGFHAGPAHHVVDRLGLADPLLARLPADTRDGWRIGHFRRAIPDGYLASIRTGTNRITDPEIARLYDDVRLATRAPLGSAGRWRAIVRLQLR